MRYHEMRLLMAGMFALHFGVLSSIPALGQTNTFPASGNVGVGTTTPVARLQVTGGGDMGVQEVARFGSDTSGNHVSLGSYATLGGLYSSGGVLLGHNVVGKHGVADALMYKTSGSYIGGHAIAMSHLTGIAFHATAVDATSGYDFSAERMRITNSGNVGIGTTTPRERLDVSGNIVAGNGPNVIVGRSYDSYGIFGVSEDAIGNPQSLVFSASNKNGTNSAYLEVYSNAATDLDLRGDIEIRAGYYEPRSMQGEIRMYTNSTPQFTLTHAGNVGIGTSTPLEKLSVNGKVRAKEVVVTTDGWADFVFDEGYELRPLRELQHYIAENGHLPEIPSAEEVQAKGIGVGGMQAKLLQKIEELTLYILQQEEKLNAQAERIGNVSRELREVQVENARLRRGTRVPPESKSE